MGKSSFLRTGIALAAAGLLLLSTGCSALGQGASDAAGRLTDAAGREVVRQACGPVQDGRLDASELKVFSSIVKSIDGGGLPDELVQILRGLAESGDGVSEDLQDRLISYCNDATAQK